MLSSISGDFQLQTLQSLQQLLNLQQQYQQQQLQQLNQLQEQAGLMVTPAEAFQNATSNGESSFIAKNFAMHSRGVWFVKFLNIFVASYHPIY